MELQQPVLEASKYGLNMATQEAAAATENVEVEDLAMGFSAWAGRLSTPGGKFLASLE